jgi:hypothetical protein
MNNPDHWRLFIDTSKVSLKVVLRHKGNRFHSIRLGHAANTKETYESIKLMLERLSMTNLSGSYVVISRLWHFTRNATRVHKILLCSVRVEQPGQEESLCK